MSKDPQCILWIFPCFRKSTRVNSQNHSFQMERNGKLKFFEFIKETILYLCAKFQSDRRCLKILRQQPDL